MLLLGKDSELEWDGFHDECATDDEARLPRRKIDTSGYKAVTKKRHADYATTKKDFESDDGYRTFKILTASHFKFLELVAARQPTLGSELAYPLQKDNLRQR